MGDTVWVILINDYPELVVKGTENDAETHRLQVQKKCDEDYAQFTGYGNIGIKPIASKYEVPFVEKED